MTEYKFSFKVPIYPCKCSVIITDDVNKSKDKLPEKLTEQTEKEEICQALYLAAWPNYAIIVLSNSDLATLDHEIGHVSRKIMEDIGFKIEATNDEPLAYLEEWLTRKIHDRIDKIKPLLDKKKKRA